MWLQFICVQFIQIIIDGTGNGFRFSSGRFFRKKIGAPKRISIFGKKDFLKNIPKSVGVGDPSPIHAYAIQQATPP